jgi:hypothetical protein
MMFYDDKFSFSSFSFHFSFLSVHSPSCFHLFFRFLVFLFKGLSSLYVPGAMSTVSSETARGFNVILKKYLPQGSNFGTQVCTLPLATKVCIFPFLAFPSTFSPNPTAPYAAVVHCRCRFS